MALHPCPDCARHVREEDRGCPFCGAEIALEASTPVARGLSRAALALASAGAIVACGKSQPLVADAAPLPLATASEVASATPSATATSTSTSTERVRFPPYGMPRRDAGPIRTNKKDPLGDDF